MKKLLSWGGSSLLTGAFLDPLFYSALDKPMPWGRDLAMAGAGALCIYLLVKYRHDL
jgi:hypothetical protein